MISVVIPTYNEAAVIEETLRRACRALEASSEPFELIVVDDSSADGTAELAESLAPQFPVRVLRRPGRLGLATAVVDGWKLARGDLLAVTDADLQHPPEVLGELVRALRAPCDRSAQRREQVLALSEHFGAAARDHRQLARLRPPRAAAHRRIQHGDAER